MRGVFESTDEGAPSGREEWSLAEAKEGRTLSSKGAGTGKGAVAWTLDARLTAASALESLELQTRPVDRPQEVTTVAVRCFGSRAYGTTIPPGGVPEKFETRFEAGSGVRAFSTALDGLCAVGAPIKVGHGRRLLVVAMDGADLLPRIGEGVLLARAKERAKVASAEEWCVKYEFRWADAPGRADTTFLATRAGVVLRSERVTPEGTRVTRLSSFEA